MGVVAGTLAGGGEGVVVTAEVSAGHVEVQHVCVGYGDMLGVVGP